jgi:hypothetical protein
MVEAKIYQIFYDAPSHAMLDPGFTPLDNSENERPDWREYWPIRRFLRDIPLADDCYYGFFSPKFKLKTSLCAEQVYGVVERHAATADVILFSPSIHRTARFMNVFEHGEAMHPGLKTISQAFLDRCYPIALDHLISDSTNTVSCNFFVARPRFWRAWSRLTEALFQIAETPADPLGELLSAAARYKAGFSAPMKVFIVERIASLILATDPDFVVHAYRPFGETRRRYKLPTAIAMDALKIAYRLHEDEQYRQVFHLLQAAAPVLNTVIRLGTVIGFSRFRSKNEENSNEENDVTAGDFRVGNASEKRPIQT